MDLLLYFLKNAEKDLAGKNVRIKVIGKKSGLTEEIFKEINRVEDSTRRNDGLVINLAINYGGREEILGAVKNISEKVKNNELKTEEITPEAFSALLYSNGCPDPDLLIRTSGEMRISNFLLWQMAYTEYWFTDKLWPDFNKSDLEEAVSIYSGRSRRYGL
jgi:undecaprenyl diphosphate synthase